MPIFRNRNRILPALIAYKFPFSDQIQRPFRECLHRYDEIVRVRNLLPHKLQDIAAERSVESKNENLDRVFVAQPILSVLP